MPNTETVRHAAGAAAATQILVNGQPQAWLPELSLADLLQQRGDPPDAVATALNGRFVPRRERAQTRLQSGDSLTIFEAITGG
jgi:sulfur carrier protein